MKKPTKQKLVLDPKSRIQELSKKELDQVIGGGGGGLGGWVPKVIDGA